MIIIILSTIKFTSNTDLIKYISFASTIASLLLALLAIVYAYLSNSTFSKNVNLINEVSNELKSNSRNLSNISDSIGEEIKKLPLTIQGVDKKVDKIPELIKELSKGEPFIMDEKRKDIENKETCTISDFLDNSSFNGLYALYAINIVYEKKIAFNLGDLYRSLGRLSIDYEWGFLVATGAMGIIDFKTSKNIWTIAYVCDEINKNIKTKLFDKGKKIQNDLAKLDIEYNFEDDIKNIEDYFND